jgi:SAM-dependent methyltransferase
MIDSLRCPCCESRLALEFDIRSSRIGLSDGVLQCDCYEYPVVGGIAVLRQMGHVSSTRNEAVEFLKHRDAEGALWWLLNNGTAEGVPGIGEVSPHPGLAARLVRRYRKLLRRDRVPPREDPLKSQKEFIAALRVVRPRMYADYLYFRHANPSLLSAIPPLVVFGDACRERPSGRVLDILCGVGHASAILGALQPGVELVMADSDFVNLFLARGFVVPRGTALCVDAELPLPFDDSSFDGLFCIDGLHYVRSKVALLREVDRVVSADGVWLFAHLHNAAGENKNPGAALTADGYALRFDFGCRRLLSEPDILNRFEKDGCLDLTSQPDVRSVASSHAFTLVGSRTDALWKNHPGLDDALCRRPDLFGFNPLFHVERLADGVMLRSAWPSESLRRECVGKVPVLPEAVHVPRHVVDELAEWIATSLMSEDVRALLRSFVVVCLPECYPRSGFPS